MPEETSTPMLNPRASIQRGEGSLIGFFLFVFNSEVAAIYKMTERSLRYVEVDQRSKPMLDLELWP